METTEKIKRHHADYIRHSLGLNYKDKPFRNHFVAGWRSKDYGELCEMVRLGLMRKGRDISALCDGDVLFHVTPAGYAAVGCEDPADHCGDANKMVRQPPEDAK